MDSFALTYANKWLCNIVLSGKICWPVRKFAASSAQLCPVATASLSSGYLHSLDFAVKYSMHGASWIYGNFALAANYQLGGVKFGFYRRR